MNRAQANKPTGKTRWFLRRRARSLPIQDAPADDNNADAHDAPVAFLVDCMSSSDGDFRQHAREKLVAIGKPAVPALIETLRSAGSQLRWEAAKALVAIADRRAAPDLAVCLQDHDPGIRWVAAEALIALKRDALVPLLEVLIEQSDSLEMCEGAHHVLHELAKDELGTVLSPVLSALEGPVPDVVAPVFAAEALEELEAADA